MEEGTMVDWLFLLVAFSAGMLFMVLVVVVALCEPHWITRWRDKIAMQRIRSEPYWIKELKESFTDTKK